MVTLSGGAAELIADVGSEYGKRERPDEASCRAFPMRCGTEQKGLSLSGRTARAARSAHAGTGASRPNSRPWGIDAILAVSSRRTTDVLHDLCRRFFHRHGFLSHLRSFERLR